MGRAKTLRTETTFTFRVRASQACIKRLAGQLDNRQLICIDNVHEESVHGLTQILETSGAELRISLHEGNHSTLFKRIPKRRRCVV